MKNFAYLGSVAWAALVWAVPVAAQDGADIEDEASPSPEVRTAAARDDEILVTSRSGRLDLPARYPGSVVAGDVATRRTMLNCQ